MNGFSLILQGFMDRLTPQRQERAAEKVARQGLRLRNDMKGPTEL